MNPTLFLCSPEVIGPLPTCNEDYFSKVPQMSSVNCAMSRNLDVFLFVQFQKNVKAHPKGGLSPLTWIPRMALEISLQCCSIKTPTKLEPASKQPGQARGLQNSTVEMPQPQNHFQRFFSSKWAANTDTGGKGTSGFLWKKELHSVKALL